MAAEDSLSKMVETIKKDKGYKILTTKEYEDLLARASASRGGDNTTSTPKPSGEQGGAKPKVPPQPTQPKLNFTLPGASPIPRLNFLNQSNQQNMSAYVPSPYVPKLPIFSGSEEPQKGETSYEVWNFEVKCLKNTAYLPEHLLLQAIRNSLRGTARNMLVPLGESATADDILEKLDGFYGNVCTSETLMQSFYSDCQKDNETIVSYGSRIERTLSRAVTLGHLDSIAKDAMLRSKFWTGLKNQTLKNSTRHLYDSIKDFKSLLREIRKVDMEESSSNPPKKQSAQQLSGQVSTDDTNAKLLKQMEELMGRMKHMEDRLEQQSKAISDSKKVSSNQESFTHNNSYNNRGRGRGYGKGYYKGSYNRGYQSGNPQDSFNDYNSQRSNRGGGSKGSNRGGTNGRGAHRGNSSSGANNSLNG